MTLLDLIPMHEGLWKDGGPEGSRKFVQPFLAKRHWSPLLNITHRVLTEEESTLTKKRISIILENESSIHEQYLNPKEDTMKIISAYFREILIAMQEMEDFNKSL